MQNQVAKTSFLEIIIRMCTPINITFYYHLQIFGRNQTIFLIRIPIQGSKYFQLRCIFIQLSIQIEINENGIFYFDDELELYT